MNIKFRTKNFNLTDGARAAIDKKLTAILGMFHEDTVFNVYIVKRDKDYKCEIKVQRGKDFVRSEETGKTIEFSVENAINTLKKRVRKVKSMKITKKRGNATLSLKAIENSNIDVDLDAPEGEELIDMKIERRKFIDMGEMSEDEAILALESLNHSFYLFRNKDLDNKVCVVYRRDVGYGLLETDN
jgi:putative sigma-54 modulation protein